MSKEDKLSDTSQAESVLASHEPDAQSVDVLGDKDYFLQNLVNITNLSVERKLIPITLQMGGLLISGLMISGDVYFTKLADIYFKDGDSVVRQLINQCGDIYREGRKIPAASPSDIVYIHLKDCTIVSNHTKSKYMTLWRGLLSKVDGFFLGTFSPVSKLPSDEEM